MASRLLLKVKLNASFSLRLVLNPSPTILTHFVAPIALHSNNLALLGTTQNLFARQMGTSRSSSPPLGNSKVSDEEDADDFDDDDDEDDDDDDEDDDFEDFDDDTLDLDENDFDDDDDVDDDDDDEEEEEEPPKKKASGKK